MRPIATLMAGFFALTTSSVLAASIDDFVNSIRNDATARGITAQTFTSATRGLTLDPSIAKLTKKQPELVKPIGGYIERRVGSLAKSGARRVDAQKRTLDRIGKTYGVDPYAVAAIWGMETGFGGNIGKSDVFRSLATLAAQGYRGDFFRGEFLDALTMLQTEGLPRSRYVGSWAGAVGQTQFIPSSFLRYAVDFDRDGKRDLWRSAADALASTANYLWAKGWVAGQPWGRPVAWPSGMKREAATRSWNEWKASGARILNGAHWPRRGEATSFFPAGAEGPAFLITANYDVIRDYNSADSYALSVALTADRLRGRKAVQLDWPTSKTVNRAQRLAIQAALRQRGHRLSNDSGRITKDVRAAIATEQRRMGVLADGYPDAELLRQLQQ
ncbi:MAG: lytic murein transglycosylase [Pseudomonadota bacterium]